MQMEEAEKSVVLDGALLEEGVATVTDEVADQKEISSRIDTSVHYSPSSISKDMYRVREELPEISELKGKVSSLKDFKDKFEVVTSFMHSCIVDVDKPMLRGFWESRKVCLSLLLSHDVDSSVKSSYGRVCKELSRDALVFKSRLNEMSNFAVEQISLAIESIQEEVSRDSEVPEDWDSSVFPEFLKGDVDFYFDHHSKLLRLSALTDRVRALREEVLKIVIRGRAKKKLLLSLSSLGNLLFPKKRELSYAISDKFLSDVEAFSKKGSEDQSSHRSAQFLLSEIRRFQALAKELQITRSSFRNIRTILSSCWDSVNTRSRGKRDRTYPGSASGGDRTAGKDRFEEFEKKISGLVDAHNSGNLSDDQFESKLFSIQKDIKFVVMDSDFVRALKKMIRDIRQPIIDVRDRLEEERRAVEKESQLAREKDLKELKDRISSLLRASDTMEVYELELEYDNISVCVGTKQFWKSERATLDKLLKQVKHVIDDRKRAPMMEISETDRSSADTLHTKLNQLYACRDEVKKRMESHKKSIEISGLDFERAICFSEMMAQDKDRLQELRRAIADVEMALSDVV